MSRYEVKESTFFTDVFKIALGVFIGGLLAALAYTKIIALGVEYAARSATASIQKELRLEGVRNSAAEQARAESERQKAANIEREKRERLRREDELRVAWRQMYKPSAACQADPSTMPCVNAHAAAHKRFTEVYGELPPRF